MCKVEYIDRNWAVGIGKLVKETLKAKIDKGQIALVRVGKYSGAESKTLSGAGVAKIKIVKGRRESTTSDKTTTYWFAADNADAYTEMLPFGWALLEIEAK